MQTDTADRRLRRPYVDVMCQITDARPVEVRGMGLRLRTRSPRICTITGICR